MNFMFRTGGSFQQQYSVYPVAMMETVSDAKRAEMERKGYITMPPSALSRLAHLEIELPMVFKLHNREADKHTHSGVLEFVAEEGIIYMPHWMMENLSLESGNMITVSNVALPPGSFVRFQPQSVAFLDIADPKAVFENVLRGFSCLTKGDIIALHYNNKIYNLKIIETKPTDAIKIIECDLEVDFAPPVGYVEPVYKKEVPKKPTVVEEAPTEVDITDVLYPGSGYRIDGKAKKPSARIMHNIDDVLVTPTLNSPSGNKVSAVLNKEDEILPYVKGHLIFYQYDELNPHKEEGAVDEEPKKEVPSVVPFSGAGQSLKKNKKK